MAQRMAFTSPKDKDPATAWISISICIVTTSQKVAFQPVVHRTDIPPDIDDKDVIL